MPDYDFHTLSPPDFEDLTRDLLQAREGVVFESFRAGRDGGIDVRHSRGRDQTVAQCKHYARSGFAKLLTDMKKEAPKVAKLGPKVTRYIVSTSVDLNPTQKQQIAHLFTPLLQTSDILGRDDLNNLLGLYSDVEKRHFKLWLSSTAVFERVVHNAEASKSDYQVARVRKTVRKFVRGTAYPEAMDRLNKERIVILAGPPGVGKTTLADILLYEHLYKNFKAILTRDDFDEARRLYHGGDAIFYYDDFLGATYLGEGGDALKRNEDRKIADFIEFVRGNAQTRLILTTRGHLLNQAVNGSEQLQLAMVDRHKLVVSLDDLDGPMRARVLYNHIYFGDLPDEYREILLVDDFYREIIRHPKFSPRLVEWLTNFVRVSRAGTTPDAYKTFVQRLLDDPSEIWRHAYERQIGEDGRSLLLSLHSLNGKASIGRLQSIFSALHAGRATAYGFARKPDGFRNALRDLTGTFVTLQGEVVSFVDPSVIDLMNAILREAPDNALDVVRHAVSLGQIQHVWSLANAAPIGLMLAALQQEPQTVAKGLRAALKAPIPFDAHTRSLEEQVVFVTRLAEALSSKEIEALIEPMLVQLTSEWAQYDDGQFEHGVLVIEALESAAWVEGSPVEAHIEPLRAHLLSKIHDGICPEDALLMWSLAHDPKTYARDFSAGLKLWLTSNFSGRLNEIQSSSEFQEFLNALNTLQLDLGIDLETRIDAVRTRWEAYEEQQDAYADIAHDTYREDRAEQYSADAELHDLFSSLRRND